MRRGIDGVAEYIAGHGTGLVARLQDTGDAEVTLPLDVLGGEPGPEHHVAHEGHRFRYCALGCTQRYGRCIPACAGAERGAEVLHLGGELERVTVTRTLVEHAAHEGGKAGQLAIEPGSSLD